jgi:predicted SprT family Zn-dependent metalloprotease
MKPAEAIQLGEMLMAEWGLIELGWTLVIDELTKTRRLGYCWFGGKELGLSRWFIEHNDWPVVEQTTKHEIAHALAYLRHGHTDHGAPWKAMCLLVGCEPSRERMSDTFKRPPARYHAICTACRSSFFRHKKPRGLYFCPCQRQLPVGQRTALKFRLNVELVQDVVKRAAERAGNDPNQPDAEVSKLIGELQHATDAGDKGWAKRTRAKLRRLNHRGGLS